MKFIPIQEALDKLRESGEAPDGNVHFTSTLMHPVYGVMVEWNDDEESK